MPEARRRQVLIWLRRLGGLRVLTCLFVQGQATVTEAWDPWFDVAGNGRELLRVALVTATVTGTGREDPNFSHLGLEREIDSLAIIRRTSLKEAQRILLSRFPSTTNSHTLSCR
jgi:hypothetical protein